MAFVCPTMETAEERLNTLQNIKHVVEKLEQSMNIGVKPVCIPTCIPIADLDDCPPKPQPEIARFPKQEPPNVMVCYRTLAKNLESKQDSPVKKADSDPLYDRSAKPFELRASFFIPCGCKRRNGLQDFCIRKECNGSPECLPFPPRCGPSKSDPTNTGVTEEQKMLAIQASRERRKAATPSFKCFPAEVKNSELNTPECIPFPRCCGPCRSDSNNTGVTEEQNMLAIQASRDRRKCAAPCFKCFPAEVKKSALDTSECIPFPRCCRPCKSEPTNAGVPEEQNTLAIQACRDRRKFAAPCFKCFPAEVKKSALNTSECIPFPRCCGRRKSDPNDTGVTEEQKSLSIQANQERRKALTPCLKCLPAEGEKSALNATVVDLAVV